MRQLLAVLQAGALARPGSLYLFAQTPAQHFHGRGKSGLYEERAEARPVQCFCGPTDASRPDWRNTKLAALLPAFGAVRQFPFWDLTQPAWHMHLANTRTRSNESEASCDCTHFCCARLEPTPAPPALTRPWMPPLPVPPLCEPASTRTSGRELTCNRRVTDV